MGRPVSHHLLSHAQGHPLQRTQQSPAKNPVQQQGQRKQRRQHPPGLHRPQPFKAGSGPPQQQPAEGFPAAAPLEAQGIRVLHFRQVGLGIPLPLASTLDRLQASAQRLLQRRNELEVIGQQDQSRQLARCIQGTDQTQPRFAGLAAEEVPGPVALKLVLLRQTAVAEGIEGLHTVGGLQLDQAQLGVLQVVAIDVGQALEGIGVTQHPAANALVMPLQAALLLAAQAHDAGFDGDAEPVFQFLLLLPVRPIQRSTPQRHGDKRRGQQHQQGETLDRQSRQHGFTRCSAPVRASARSAP